MRGKAIDIVQGTLNMLIFQTLAEKPLHGWGIRERIHELSKNALQVRVGSLYPALSRLQKRGLITFRRVRTKKGLMGKRYNLTRAGRAQLRQEIAHWDRLSAAVDRVAHYAKGYANEQITSHPAPRPTSVPAPQSPSNPRRM